MLNILLFHWHVSPTISHNSWVISTWALAGIFLFGPRPKRSGSHCSHVALRFPKVPVPFGMRPQRRSYAGDEKSPPVANPLKSVAWRLQRGWPQQWQLPPTAPIQNSACGATAPSAVSARCTPGRIPCAPSRARSHGQSPGPSRPDGRGMRRPPRGPGWRGRRAHVGLRGWRHQHGHGVRIRRGDMKRPMYLKVLRTESFTQWMCSLDEGMLASYYYILLTI